MAAERKPRACREPAIGQEAPFARRALEVGRSLFETGLTPYEGEHLPPSGDTSLRA